MPSCPPCHFPLHHTLRACYPQLMDSQKSAQQPIPRRRGATFRSQNARLHTLNFAPESDSFLTSAKIWVDFSLVLDITLETNTPSQAQNHSTINRHLTVFSCLTCIFTTPQNRVMSSKSTITRAALDRLLIERLDPPHRLRVQLPHHRRHQFHRLVEVTAADQAVVAVQVSRGDGYVDAGSASPGALHLRAVLPVAADDGELQRDAVFGCRLHDQVAQL